MATAFVEATLAQRFKAPQPDGTFRGGPAYYIERGLGSRLWGSIFAVLLIFTFGLAFNAVQANTIADTLNSSHGIPPLVTAIGLVILAAPVVFGGMRTIARVAEWMLPLMALIYVALVLIIIVLNIGQLPGAIALIIRSALGLDQATAGAFGGVAAALLNGVRRGLFFNEAGMGSAPNAAATVRHPVTQGFIQAFGVFVDTIIICSATAFIILLSGVYDPAQPSEVAGAAPTQASLAAWFGTGGIMLMTLVIFLFAFSSILGNYAYADGNLTYLGASAPMVTAFRVIVLVAVAGGSLAALPTVWSVADVAMGLMALVNLVAILLLGRWALGALADSRELCPTGPHRSNPRPTRICRPGSGPGSGAVNDGPAPAHKARS